MFGHKYPYFFDLSKLFLHKGSCKKTVAICNYHFCLFWYVSTIAPNKDYNNALKPHFYWQTNKVKHFWKIAEAAPQVFKNYFNICSKKKITYGVFKCKEALI